MASSASCISILPTRATLIGMPRRVCGVLEKLEPVGEGLIYVNLSGMERLADESLFETLQGLMGKRVAIWHLDGRWGACEAAVV